MQIRRAHAKINWSLRVAGRREDGYHELEMLMQQLDLYDEMVFEKDQALSLTIDGDSSAADPDNLVLRAARALNERCGTAHGARIRLRKNIPARAGLGGGSSDCAATLSALNRLWELNLTREDLLQLAVRLGADVPYCLTGGFVRAGGIGERLRNCSPGPCATLCVVFVGDGLSTQDVFRQYDLEARAANDTADPDALAHLLSKRDFEQAQTFSCNDLETPAIRLLPEIGDAMRRMAELGARFVRMSGSGSAVYGVFDRDARAKAAARCFRRALVAHTLPEAADS